MNKSNTYDVEMQTYKNEEKVKMYPLTKASNIIISETENLNETVEKFKSDITNITEHIKQSDETLDGKLKFVVGYENPPEELPDNILYGMILEKPEENNK